MGGCATSGGGSKPTPARSKVAGEERGQWLFRAELQSGGERATLRLALRQYSEEQFDLSAADAFGQLRWRLLVDGADAAFIQASSRSYCRIFGENRLTAGELRFPLPIGSFAKLLRGRLPAAGTQPEIEAERTGEVQFEIDGQRWTGDRADGGGGGEWLRWTLWEGERPVLWFQQEGGEASLSASAPPFRLRWRETAYESLSSEQAIDWEILAGFVENECREASPS